MPIGGHYKNFDEIPSNMVTDFPIFEDPNIPPQEIDEFYSILDKLSNQINPTIVDFGGANGKYGTFAQKRKNYQNFTYIIIETPQTCKELGNKHPFAKYYTSIYNVSQPIDLFISNSAIQFTKSPDKELVYIKNKLTPEYISCQRIPTNPITQQSKSFVTIYNFEPHKIANWIFSINEFEEILLPEYKLVYKIICASMNRFYEYYLYNYLFKKNT